MVDTPLIAGRYRLESLIGAGAMGQVWRAEDQRLRRRVAVKLVDLGESSGPATAQRFEREAIATARLHHPSIVTMFDAGTDGSTAYLVMQLVDGESLADRLRRGPLAPDEAAGIGLRMAEALEAAHAIGVLHRDIKPGNVMVRPVGPATGGPGSSAWAQTAEPSLRNAEVTVLDFGIAQLADETAAQVTSPLETVGTAAYLAPERAVGGAGSAASDVYSLGCVLMAMLAGRPPFTGGPALEIVQRQVSEPPPRLRDLRPDCPGELAALVDAMLAKEPARRPDLRSAITTLREVAGGGPVAGRRPAPGWQGPTGTAVLPPASPTPTRVGPTPAPAARRAPGSGDVWFRRALSWILRAIVAVALLAVLWFLGERVVAWLGDRMPALPGVTAPTSSADEQPAGPGRTSASRNSDQAPGTGSKPPARTSEGQRPPITLPSLQLPTLPSLPLPTVPGARDAGLQAAVGGVTTALDAWAPRDEDERKAKRDLTKEWSRASTRILAGKDAVKALEQFEEKVSDRRDEGEIPVAVDAGLRAGLAAVRAQL